MDTRSSNKGVSMATAIVLGALALTLAITLAGMSFSHLSVSSRLSNIHQARSLAEAALAQAIERVVTHEGEYFKTASLELTVTMPHLPGGRGRLTFDPAQATAWGIPPSLNNLDSDLSATGFRGRVVPQKSIHFVAVGEYAGVTKRMEAILNIPTYKYALSSKGRISSVGEMIVAAADNPTDVLPSATDKLDELLPGHILSNSSDNAYALDLNAGSGRITVTGDARAVGGIYPNGGSLDIQGSLRPNSPAADMPVIELNDYDPFTFGGAQGFADPPPPVQVADGVYRHNGDLTLEELRLPTDSTGALIWVNGDLTITKGVSGVGALFATGDITIQKAGQASVTADNVLAVVAGKELRITGGGIDSAFFQGVVASGDSTSFQEVTVLGAVVVGATQVGGTSVGSPNPTLTLTDANFISVPENISFDFKYPFGMGAGGGGGTAYGWSIDHPDPNIPLDPMVLTDIREKRGEDGQDAFDLAHLFDRSTDDYEERNWALWDGFANYQYDDVNHTWTGSPWGFYRAADDSYLSRAELEQLLKDIVSVHGYEINGNIGGPYDTWAKFFATEPFSSHSEIIDHMVTHSVSGGPNSFSNQLARANDAYDDKFKGQSQETGTFTMDPNQYVNWDTRTRILLWRDL